MTQIHCHRVAGAQAYLGQGRMDGVLRNDSPQVRGQMPCKLVQGRAMAYSRNQHEPALCGAQGRGWPIRQSLRHLETHSLFRPHLTGSGASVQQQLDHGTVTPPHLLLRLLESSLYPSCSVILYKVSNVGLHLFIVPNMQWVLSSHACPSTLVSLFSCPFCLFVSQIPVCWDLFSKINLFFLAFLLYFHLFSYLFYFLWNSVILLFNHSIDFVGW